MQVLCKSYIPEGGSDDELAYMRMANDIESRMKSGACHLEWRGLPDGAPGDEGAQRTRPD
jgi:hypothetical protein